MTPVLGKCSAESESRFTHDSNFHKRWNLWWGSRVSECWTTVCPNGEGNIGREFFPPEREKKLGNIFQGSTPRHPHCPTSSCCTASCYIKLLLYVWWLCRAWRSWWRVEEMLAFFRFHSASGACCCFAISEVWCQTAFGGAWSSRTRGMKPRTCDVGEDGGKTRLLPFAGSSFM